MKTIIALCAAALTLPVVAAHAQSAAPNLLVPYVDQLVQQCGGKPSAGSVSDLAQRIDLNGDKVDDYVVDAGRYPCPSRPAAIAARGSQLTVFMGDKEGRILPALQRTGFSAHLEKDRQGELTLWFTLGGSDCGEENAAARCDRRVVWNGSAHRLELSPANNQPK